MAKINFSKLPCYTDIRKVEKREMDLKYDFSNQMYINGNGVAMGALAMKIYNSQGEEEYNEQECALMLQFSESLPPIFVESLKDAIEGK